MTDGYKEVIPVIYDESAVRYLPLRTFVPNHQCFAKHWHDRMELLYIVSGTLELELGDTCVTVGAGQVAVIEPRKLHRGKSGGEGMGCYTFMFDVEQFCNQTIASDKYLAPLARNGDCFGMVAEHGEIADNCRRMAELMDAGETNPLRIVAIVYDILGLLYQHCRGESRVFYQADKKFREIVEYINGHFAEDISLTEISSRFGYDKAYFCRRFRESTGMTTMRYIKLLRLEMARKLLAESDMGVGDIAAQCGFSEIGYFSNCFKKQYGVSPMEYKRMQVI